MKRIILISLIATMMTASVLYGDSWSQFQKDSKHQAKGTNATIDGPLCVKWAKPVVSGYKIGQARMPLANSSGVGFYNNYYKVYAFDVITGETKWEKVHYGLVNAPMMLYNDKIIVAYDNGYSEVGFLCLKQSDGSLVWKVNLPSPIVPGYLTVTGVVGEIWITSPKPTLHNGKVYIGTNKGYLVKVNADTGQTEFTKLISNYAIMAAPAVDDDGTIYVGSQDGRMRAINPDGSLKWQFNAASPIYGSATIDANHVYFGATSGKIYVLNKLNGALVNAHVTYNIIYGTGSISNGAYIIGSDDRRVYALHTSTGLLKWVSTNFVDNFVQMGCVVVNCKVFITGCVNKVYMLECETGSVVDTCITKTGSYTTPGVWNDTIMFTSGDGYLYGIGPCGPDCGVCDCDISAIPTSTITQTITEVVTATPVLTATPSFTMTPSMTITSTITVSNTNTPTLTNTITMTATDTFTSSPTDTPIATGTSTSTITSTVTLTITSTVVWSPTITPTNLPCDGIHPPEFTVELFFNPEATDNEIIEVTSSVPLVNPPVVVVYPHGNLDENDKNVLTLQTELIPGETNKYRALYPKQTGFGDIDKIVVKGTDYCGKEGVSDGDFKKQVIPGKDVQVFDNVIKVDEGESTKVLYNIYAGDHVTINVYTRDGGIVKNLFEGDVTERGTGEIIWDGTKKDGSIVSSGIYILLIKTSYYETTVKISVLR